MNKSIQFIQLMDNIRKSFIQKLKKFKTIVNLFHAICFIQLYEIQIKNKQNYRE